jgi:hypothetical protein
MSTRKKPAISNALICRLYEQGESRQVIAMRARVPEPAIREILIACGVRLRTSEEVNRINGHRRAAWRDGLFSAGGSGPDGRRGGHCRRLPAPVNGKGAE